MLIGMSGETHTPVSNVLSGFEETVKDFWASRPRRPRGDRKMAGVAAAIGYRYGIDPVVVRVALVAATVFGGAGLVLYLLGWLFFPNEGDQVSAFEAMIGRGQSSVSTGCTVLLCIALIPVSAGAFAHAWFANGGFDGSGFIGLALLGAALYLLHRSRGQNNRPVVPGPQGPGYAPGGYDAAFSMTDTDSRTASADPSAPPAWDPLGAAPSGWDLAAQPAPRPTPPPPPRPVIRRNKTIGVATFGIALLVAGVGVVANLGGQEWFSVSHIIGMTLAVLGIGLVAGSFVRGGRGLIALAIPLAIAGMALTAVPVLDFKGGYGDISPTPASAPEVLSSYQRAAGNVDLDLTKLPADAVVRTTVRVVAGNATVIVPAAADVTYDCETTAGDLDCLGHHQSGFANDAVTGTDSGLDGVGGQRINLVVRSAAGNVEVRRG
jgi:phage shock protein PspC (stress-responsive transcriptional regulator)